MSMIVQSPGYIRRASFTKTYANTAGNGATGTVALFTVTGQVLLVYITAICTTTLTGATATITLETTSQAGLFIAATTATTITSTNFVWTSVTPVAGAQALPAAMKEIIVGENIINRVAVAGVTAGVVEYDVYWVPLSSNGLVA